MSEDQSGDQKPSMLLLPLEGTIFARCSECLSVLVEGTVAIHVAFSHEPEETYILCSEKQKTRCCGIQTALPITFNSKGEAEVAILLIQDELESDNNPYTLCLITEKTKRPAPNKDARMRRRRSP